jgi:hypothetical protein
MVVYEAVLPVVVGEYLPVEPAEPAVPAAPQVAVTVLEHAEDLHER